ncbi:hypothetical protein E3P99_01205 [Wallemia hederae]|uniref:Prokaryotic-type class I peptide chain release factors domain-containing protein n=1 Tax=Wallemia hederae TaxID=1540922 RepID=A0A4T0FQV8_9BASI|nr:hypothetical protein E3P99_01205 [Wallemia hederae]
MSLVRSIATSARAGVASTSTLLTKLREEDLLEKFVKGQGKGGQAVNKTSNKVYLLHTPTGLSVECHATRSLISNRSQARKLLQDKYDSVYNPSESKVLKKIDKLQRAKKNATKKSKRKYASLSATDFQEEKS